MDLKAFDGSKRENPSTRNQTDGKSDVSDQQLKAMNMEYMRHSEIARLTRMNKWLLIAIVVLGVVVCAQAYWLHKNALEGPSGDRHQRFSSGGWSPFEGFQEMQKQMDLFFKDELHGFDSILPGMQSFSFGGPFSQQHKLEEDQQSYIVTFSIPGLDRSNLKVTVEDQILRLSGQMQGEKKSKRDNGSLQKTYHSHVEKYMTLPGPVAPETLEVSYKENTLVVRVGKKLQL